MFNHSQIMALAWARAKQQLWSLRAPATRLRALFIEALRDTWAEAKTNAARELADAAHWAKMAVRSAHELRTIIFSITCNDRLTAADYANMATLRRELIEAERRAAMGVLQ